MPLPVTTQSRFVREILLPGGSGIKPSIDARYTPFSLRVGPSPIDRWGVFAMCPIPRRRIVIEYTGERITPEQAEYRSLRPRNYLFELNDGSVIDGVMGGSGAEFINHSHEPNLRFRVWQGRVFLVSLRAIAADEELTVDYNLTESTGPRG